METTGIPLDIADPVAVLLAWALTMLLGHFIKLADRPKLRTALPIVAVLIAVAVRAGIEAGQGADALTGEVLLRGMLAGATAVLAHSQFRAVLKVALKPKELLKGMADSSEKLVMLLLISVPLLAVSQACGSKQVVIHNADTYEAELSWLKARNDEQVTALQRGVDLSLYHKQPDDCLMFADALVVSKYATAWRYDVMLFIAERGEDPGAAPEIPDALALCPTEAL